MRYSGIGESCHTMTNRYKQKPYRPWEAPYKVSAKIAPFRAHSPKFSATKAFRLGPAILSGSVRSRYSGAYSDIKNYGGAYPRWTYSPDTKYPSLSCFGAHRNQMRAYTIFMDPQRIFLEPSSSELVTVVQ